MTGNRGKGQSIFSFTSCFYDLQEGFLTRLGLKKSSFVCLFVFWDKVSLCSPGWPWTHKDLPLECWDYKQLPSCPAGELGFVASEFGLHFNLLWPVTHPALVLPVNSLQPSGNSLAYIKTLIIWKSQSSLGHMYQVEGQRPNAYFTLTQIYPNFSYFFNTCFKWEHPWLLFFFFFFFMHFTDWASSSLSVWCLYSSDSVNTPVALCIAIRFSNCCFRSFHPTLHVPGSLLGTSQTLPHLILNTHLNLDR